MSKANHGAFPWLEPHVNVEALSRLPLTFLPRDAKQSAVKLKSVWLQQFPAASPLQENYTNDKPVTSPYQVGSMLEASPYTGSYGETDVIDSGLYATVYRPSVRPVLCP